MDNPAAPLPHRINFADAALHAADNVPVFAPHTTAAEVLAALTGHVYAIASHIVVCEEGRYRGMLTIERLLAAKGSARLETLMDSTGAVLSPGGDQEVAAWRAVQNAEAALAVVDNDNNFIGLIPPHKMVALLLAEHAGEVSLLGEFLKKTSAARQSSQESTLRRILHRLPWLLLGLAGAMFAADLVGWFETQLQLKMMLAFFIPGIVYMADAVGTQTETLVVRGLSVGVSIKRMLLRELLTGLAIGMILALVALPLIWLRWEDADLALSVALALFVACSTSTLIAMGLPWLFDARGIDPAFGSGPLATVLQDLLSILIYFLIAAAIIS